MAESQVLFPYNDANLAALQAAISDPRFATYLAAAGRDPAFAFGLYLYNARLAKALLYPLHVVEVTLRNGIDTLLCKLHGPAWPTDPALRSMLTPESLAALEKAIQRAEEEKGSIVPRGQIVATLTFDFWSNLFRPEYDRPLWQVNLRQVLPNLSPGLTRPDVQKKVKAVNRLRNRIAHHEPIFGLDVTGSYRTIVDLVDSRCPITAGWMKHHSTVGNVIRTRPTKENTRHPTIGEVCDPKFITGRGSDKLSQALAAFDSTTAVLIRTNDANDPTAAVTANQLLAFVMDKAAQQRGLIDLGEHDLDEVVTAQNAAGTWVGIDKAEPVALAVQALRAAAIKTLIVTEASPPGLTISGVVLRAHRRY